MNRYIKLWLCVFAIVLLIGGVGCEEKAKEKNTGPTPGTTAGSGTASTPPTYNGVGSGTEYWIDILTGNDLNSGDIDNPWASINKLEGLSLTPGDLVHIKTGVYDITGALLLSNLSGTSGAWIGIEAEGDVTLINSDTDKNVIEFSNCQYVYLKGCGITHDNRSLPYASWDGVAGVRFTTDCNNISIDSCTIYNVGSVGISSQADLCTDLTVYNCEIYNCSTGIYWGFYEDANKRYVHNGRIANNYIHHCPPTDLDGSGYGIQIKGGSRGNIIEDNVMITCAGYNRAAIAVYHISTFAGAETNRNIVRGNYIRGSRGQGIYAVEGAVIENNILHYIAYDGIHVSLRSTGYGIFYGNLAVSNNTVNSINSSSSGIHVGGGVFTAPFTLTNNLVMVSGSAQAMYGPGSFGGTAASNYIYGPILTGGNLGDVALTDTSCVQSTSPGSAVFLFPNPTGVLIGTGDASSASANDFNGTPRDASPDVGAYESTDGSNPGWLITNGFKQ